MKKLLLIPSVLLLMGAGCFVDTDFSLVDYSVTLPKATAESLSEELLTTLDDNALGVVALFEQVHGPLDANIAVKDIDELKKEANFRDPNNVVIESIEDDVKSELLNTTTFESISRVYGTYTCGNSEPVGFDMDLLYEKETNDWQLVDFHISRCQ